MWRLDLTDDGGSKAVSSGLLGRLSLCPVKWPISQVGPGCPSLKITITSSRRFA